jgi:uncharacterized membrane protein YGL010W
MRTAADWLHEYGDSHHNHINKVLHWMCVPVIVWCVLGLLWSLPFPAHIRAMYPVANWAGVTVVAALFYYSFLSIRLALGVLPLLLVFLWSLDRLDRWGGAPLWSICVILFVAAWIGQFIGHAIEGRRPSFLKDVQFLMIGPLWLLADVYRRWGIRY